MENFDITLAQNIAYIVAAILFITGIKMLGKEATAQRGNVISAVGMFIAIIVTAINICLLYTSPSPRDATLSRMPSSA